MYLWYLYVYYRNLFLHIPKRWVCYALTPDLKQNERLIFHFYRIIKYDGIKGHISLPCSFYFLSLHFGHLPNQTHSNVNRKWFYNYEKGESELVKVEGLCWLVNCLL